MQSAPLALKVRRGILPSTTTTIPKRVTARVYRVPVKADFLATVRDAEGGQVVVVGARTRPRSPHSESFAVHLMLELDVLMPPATKWAKLAFDGDRLTREGQDLPADELAVIARALALLVKSWQPAEGGTVSDDEQAAAV